MINMVISELSSSQSPSDTRNESIAWIVWKVFETLQQFGQQEALREWSVVAVPRFDGCYVKASFAK